MSLSDEEQRLLAQLEASLAQEDPRLASTLRGTAPKILHRRRAVFSIIGLVAGVALLLLGMQTHWSVSVLGFLVMLVSTVIGIGAWQRPPAGDQPVKPDQTPPKESPFIGRMEERWRRRQDGS